MQRGSRAKILSGDEQLFVSLADGVSHTMLQLAALSDECITDGELLRSSDTDQWQAVHDLTRTSLQLLESYTLTMRLQGGSASPEFEPVSVLSLLYDTLHELEPYAAQLSVRLELDVPQRLEPITSDRAILQSALLSLGQVFVAAQSQTDQTTPAVLRLGAHRGGYGVVTGWYGQGLQLTTGALNRARKLGGWAQQPYAELVSGPASGVFIADSLLSSLATKLHVGRYHNATGLAITLPACRQLQLV